MFFLGMSRTYTNIIVCINKYRLAVLKKCTVEPFLLMGKDVFEVKGVNFHKMSAKQIYLLLF